MISVIIPTSNAEKTLGPCLENLNNRESKELIEVIIVDGGSSDNTLNIAEAAGARIIQYDGKNSAKARNQALATAQGEIICFTNGDCVPGKDWLTIITAPFSDARIIGCKGSYVTSQQNVVARFVQLEYEEKYERLQRESTIDFIDGYSAAYRRDTLEVNDGFDERFPRLEDQELSYRLASRGYRMIFIPDASVRHNHFTRIGQYWRSKFQTAYWKSQIVRKFPDRAYRDSYTPQMLKIQMLLVACFLLALLSVPVTTNAFIIPTSLGFVFFLTTLPFVLRAWPRDRMVAFLAPFFLAGRATALGFGYFLGAIRFTTVSDRQENTISGLSYLLKRGVDLFGSLFGLCLLLLSYPAIGLAIRLTSRGPVIYSQERVGRGGQTFTMYKFRSMFVGADNEAVHKKVEHEPEYKLPDDPRITPAGKFLRRWSLDELPQFWNVLKGDMSLVGPRPEQTSIVALYSDRHRLRLTVKPGMTGPMQISGRADLALDERVSLEVEYIEDYSLMNDLLILVRTFPAVLQGRGAR